MKHEVVILGASANPERYSYKAFKMLKEYGYHPVLVSPKGGSVEGTTVVPNLNDVKQRPIRTLTMYVGPEISTKLKQDILDLKPQRVIFNPGSENPELQSNLEKHGIRTVDACTLVLLRTDQFETA